MKRLPAGFGQYVLLLATVVVVVSFLQTRATSLEQHNARLNLLLQLQAADAALDRDVLRVTSFRLQQYDPLVMTQWHIRDLLLRLEETLQIKDDPVAEQLGGGLNGFRAVMEEKFLMQERIKSIVALVRNALHYLPLAADELRAKSQKAGVSAAQLLNLLYRYNLFPSAHQATLIREAVDEFVYLSEVSTGENQEFDNILFHIRANLSLTGDLAALQNEYVTVPSGARLQDLYRSYSELYTAQVRRADAYTLALVALTLILFFTLGITLRNLSVARAAAERSWNQLRDAVESLSEAFALFSDNGVLQLHNRRYVEFYPWLRDKLELGVTRIGDIMMAHRGAGAFVSEPVGPFARARTDTDRDDHGPSIQLEELEGGLWYRASDTFTSNGGVVCVRIDISDSKRTERELRKLYRALEQSPASVVITDTTGTIEYVNPKFEEVTGYRCEDVLGKNPRILKSGDKSESEYKELWDTILAGKVWRGMFHNIRKDGRIYWEAASISPVRDEQGHTTHFIAVKEDITARKRAEDQLRMNATVFETTTEGIMVTDADNRIQTVNPAFTQITGYSCDEIIGRNPRVLSSGRHDPDFYRSMWELLERTGYWNGEVWNRRKDGTVYPEWLSLALIRDEDGAVREHVAVFSDISQRKQDEEQIRRQANYDALTGLPNRSLLFDRIERALSSARREGWNVALLFVDLDRFKVVNDTMGHVAGDALLQQVASRLSGCVRETDTVSRFGGDEFVIVLEDIKRAQDAATIAETLISQLGLAFPLGSREGFVGASVGITLYPADGEDSASLLRNADLAMYRAKKAGRNTYRFYTRDMDQSVQKRMDMERELRQALAREELYLVYQPIVELETGQMVGTEALLRWRHPRLGLVGPDHFIPLAEETGLIDKIGRWLLQQACATLAGWRAQGRDLRMSINLSSRQVALGLDTTAILRCIEASGVPPDKITLEITERLILDCSAEVLGWLERLHEQGVRLAVDDFGTGYSSLSYLKRFPMDFIKIDRSFVNGLPASREDGSLVRAILAMADSLHMGVVAEGIETQAQAAFLLAEGCVMGQGFLYSPGVESRRILDMESRLQS